MRVAVAHRGVQDLLSRSWVADLERVVPQLRAIIEQVLESSNDIMRGAMRSRDPKLVEDAAKLVPRLGEALDGIERLERELTRFDGRPDAAPSRHAK